MMKVKYDKNKYCTQAMKEIMIIGWSSLCMRYPFLSIDTETRYGVPGKGLHVNMRRIDAILNGVVATAPY